MKLRNVGSLQQQLQQYEAESSTGRGDPDLGADMAAMCRSASGSGGAAGGSARASRHRPRAALPGRWLQSSDVQTMAAELGLDPIARPHDAELLWIAEEALAAAEPQGWSREKALDMDGREMVVFEHWASGEQLPEHPVRTYYKELVQRTRRDRRRGYHAAAGSGSPPPPPGTLKQARLQAVQGSLEGELGTAVRWLGWGETSNVCEILLNAVKPRIPRALRGELSIRLGAPPLCTPRCDLSLGLSSPGHEGRPLYSLSAFRHLNTNLAAHTAGRGGGGSGAGGHGETPPASPSHVTGHYTVRLEPHDGQVAGAEESAFCGKLLCGLTGSHSPGGQADGSQFVFCDDPANFYGWPRELGAVVVRGLQDGSHVHVLLPRVQPGGGTAQFRVLRPQDGMLAKFRRGDDVQHMMSLQGHLIAHRSRGDHGPPTSWALKLFSETHGSVVFAFRMRCAEAEPEPEGGTPPQQPTPQAAAAAAPSDPYGPAVEMSFAHPLSPYQAGCLALAIAHHLEFAMPGATLRPGTPPGRRLHP